MPNLAGICDLAAAPAELESDLGRMLDAADIPDFGYARRSIASPGVACGNLLTRVEDNLSQPARDEAAGVWLMLDGEVLNADDLRRELAASGRDTAGLDDAGIALAAYLTWGEAFLDRLSGQWNLVLHHAPTRTTILASDRFGSRILHYAHDGARLVFASEIKAVIAGRKVESRAGGFGLFELFAGPYLHGDRTWIEGVRVLDPGTVLRVSPRGVARSRYWRIHFNEGQPRMAEDSYVEAFAHRLRRAVDRNMRGARPIGITLSGGLDSRSIALSIDPRRRPIPALTYGDPDSADVRYARQLAQVIGLEHHYVEGERERLLESSRRALDEALGPAALAPRGFYTAQLDRMVWRDECQGDMTGTTSMLWHPIYSRLMNVMLQGACGDALTGSHLSLRIMTAPRREALIAALCRGQYFQDRETLSLVFAPRFLDRFFGEKEAEFERLFGEIDADEPAAVASVWDMENRQRRGAFSTFTIERYFCTVRAPYLDYELAELLASIPAKWRFQQRIYKKMIVRAYPEAAHVPWAYTEGRITASPAYELAREGANWVRRRAERLIARKRRHVPSYAFRDNVALLRADPEASREISTWLGSDTFDPATFNASGIRELVRLFLSGAPGTERLMIPYGCLCAVARAHRWFLSGPIPPIPPEANPARFDVLPPQPAQTSA